MTDPVENAQHMVHFTPSVYKSLKMDVSFSVDDAADEEELHRIINGVAADLVIKLRNHQGAVMFSWPAETIIVFKSPAPSL